MGSPVGLLAKDLVETLRNATDNHVRFLHVSRPYVPGGLRWSRLINYLQIHLRLPLTMLGQKFRAGRENKSFVVVATTNPPLIYWTAMFVGRIVRIPVVIWYQDGNVDFIGRKYPAFARSWLMRMVNGVDAWVFNRAAAIVALDEAMRDSLIKRLRVMKPIYISPPWATYLSPGQRLRCSSRHRTIRLLYAGNYGKSHDLQPLADMLIGKSTSPTGSVSVSLHFIGLSVEARTELQAMFGGMAGDLQFFPRLPDLNDLKTKMQDYDFGIVSLAENYAGISAPSKAYTYLSQGLPILYVGPGGTGAEQMVRDGYGLDLKGFKQLCQGLPAVEAFVHRDGSIFPDPRVAAIKTFTDLLRSF